MNRIILLILLNILVYYLYKYNKYLLISLFIFMIYYTLKISKTIEGNYNIKDDYYFIDNNLDNDNEFYKYNFAKSLNDKVKRTRKEHNIFYDVIKKLNFFIDEYQDKEELPNQQPCIGEFTSWSECSRTCGLGSQYRKYNIIQKAGKDGIKCIYEDGYLDDKSCDNDPCEKDEECDTDNDCFAYLSCSPRTKKCVSNDEDTFFPISSIFSMGSSSPSEPSPTPPGPPGPSPPGPSPPGPSPPTPGPPTPPTPPKHTIRPVPSKPSVLYGGILIKNTTGKSIDVVFDKTLPPCNADKNNGNCNPPNSNGGCPDNNRIYGDRDYSKNPCTWKNSDAKFYVSDKITEKSNIKDITKYKVAVSQPDSDPHITLKNKENLFMSLPRGMLKNKSGDSNTNKIHWCSYQESLKSNVCTGSRMTFRLSNTVYTNPPRRSIFEANFNRPIISKSINSKKSFPVSCSYGETPVQRCPDSTACPVSKKCQYFNGLNQSLQQYYIDLSNVDAININTNISFRNVKFLYNDENKTNVYDKLSYDKISCTKNSFDVESNCGNGNESKCVNPSHNGKKHYDLLECKNPNGLLDGGMDKVICHNLWNTNTSKVCNVNLLTEKYTDVKCNNNLSSDVKNINSDAISWIKQFNKYVDHPENVTEKQLDRICQGYYWAYDEQVCKGNDCYTDPSNVDNFIKNNLIDNPFKPLKTVVESYIDPNLKANAYDQYKDVEDKILIIVEITGII
jgi:hypothetical protein